MREWPQVQGRVGLLGAARRDGSVQGAANGAERGRRAGSAGSGMGVDAGGGEEDRAGTVPGGPELQLGFPIPSFVKR